MKGIQWSHNQNWLWQSRKQQKRWILSKVSTTHVIYSRDLVGGLCQLILSIILTFWANLNRILSPTMVVLTGSMVKSSQDQNSTGITIVVGVLAFVTCVSLVCLIGAVLAVLWLIRKARRSHGLMLNGSSLRPRSLSWMLNTPTAYTVRNYMLVWIVNSVRQKYIISDNIQFHSVLTHRLGCPFINQWKWSNSGINTHKMPTVKVHQHPCRSHVPNAHQDKKITNVPILPSGKECVICDQDNSSNFFF